MAQLYCPLQFIGARGKLCCNPLTLAEAISNDFEVRQSDSWWQYGDPDFPEWWCDYQISDPYAIALRALLDIDGDGGCIFDMILEVGLSSQDAASCDIGRSLWVWAIRNG